MSSETGLQQRPVLMGLNVAVLLVFILTLIFFGLARRPVLRVFLSSVFAKSEKYYIEITPPTWAYNIWGLIYLWQALWIIYSLTLTGKTNPEGPLYLNPILLSSVFFIVYILNLVFNISWLFLFDRELLELSFVFLFFIPFTLYICLWYSYTALEANKSALAESGRMVDDVLIRVFVHNGLAIYAAWTTISTFVNMGIVMAYRSNPPISQSIASTISLVFILVTLFVFIATDLTVFDKYSRYTFTPYVVVIWAMGGIIAKNFDLKKANTIISLVLLSLGIVALVLKIIFVAVRS